jgi:broad specificity phosphatase PhoE
MSADILANATLTNLASLPAVGPVSLILRHSEREHITGDDHVFIARLTPEGIAAAQDFGCELACLRRLGRIISSPVSRCVDTAVAIAQGAGAAEKVRVDDRLSHLQMQSVWDALPDCCNFENMPGGMADLIELLLPQSTGEDNLDVFVTHDTVVGALAGYLTGEPVQAEAIPRFLEGVFIWQDVENIHFWWRGKIATINADHHI